MPLWMTVVEWLARLILAGLVGLSIWSISIILDRRNFIKALNIDSQYDELKKIFDKYDDSKRDTAFDQYFYQLQKSYQKGIGVLGTLGSTTPFIGLLGTILGIIVAFGELSQGSAGTNSIMFALAEALILTAVGLFVAIPAVIAFNYFNKKFKEIIGELRSKIDTYSLEK